MKMSFPPAISVRACEQVEAQVLAGRKLMEGAADAQAGGAGWSTHAPVCSGQAYFVTDGRPCNLQAFADGVLDGLGGCLAFPGVTVGLVV